MAKSGGSPGISRNKIYGFLKELGLHRSTAAKVFTDDFWRDVKRAGGDLKTFMSSGGFGVEAQDIYFISEELARRSLSADYDRLAEHIADFGGLNGFPDAPQRIADLGGGTGILAMWLATRHPGCRVTVYDHATKQLNLGKKWASERKIENIEFLEASYQQLAKAPPSHDYDLVLMFHGLDLDFLPSEVEKVFRYRDTQGTQIETRSEIQAAAIAIAGLLKPDGVGVITGRWSEWGLIHLFHAVRQTTLGVDWSLTVCQGTMNGDDFVAEKNYIFVRHGIPRVTHSAWEDARAYISSGQYFGKTNTLGNGLMESFGELFDSGRELLAVEAHFHNGGIHRLRLLQNAGLIFLESTSTKGFRQGKLHSVAAVTEFVQLIHEQMRVWESGKGVSVKGYRVNPEFQRFLDYSKIASSISST